MIRRFQLSIGMADVGRISVRLEEGDISISLEPIGDD